MPLAGPSTAFVNEVSLRIVFVSSMYVAKTVPNSKVKITYPVLKFAEKARRPGGLSRQAAIAAAVAGVESLREDSIEGIADTVEKIERILSDSERLGAEQLDVILGHADRIVTLAETFGYTVTAFIAKSLCDLLQYFVETRKSAREPLVVHVNSMRLVMPPNTATQEDCERILGELSRILVFYGCMPREEVRLRALRKLGIFGVAKDPFAGGTKSVAGGGS